jgi:acetolactate synthase-1/2/3 large subunit
VKLSDYVAQTLVDAGITEVFSVVGGASMHLNDSFAKHPDLRVTYFAHENACVCAAESYFRLTGRLACVCVTAGPGSLNAVTGVHGAYCDSMGMIVISGQCDSRTINRDLRFTGQLRQLGDQETPIMEMVRDITKYAEEIIDVYTTKNHLFIALGLATTRRPGPVWLSIPVDIQAREVNPAEMQDDTLLWEEELPDISNGVHALMDRLVRARRPVSLAGSGIRTAGAVEEFRALVELLGIPVVTAYNGHDLIPSDHPCYIGRQGTIGDIAGNLAVQKSDFLLILGSRCNIRSVSFNWDAFAPKAYKVMVDIDEAELTKPFPKIDLPIHADLKEFLSKLLHSQEAPQ